MKPVPADVVERVSQMMSELPHEAAPKLIERMSKKQPLMLAYLMAVDHDLLNEDERELLVYLGVTVWQIMSEGNPSLRRVTEKMLDKAEGRNVRMAEYLKGETESGFIGVTRSVFDSYNQREVLRFVVEAIMEEPEEGEVIRDEAIGALFLDLKTVIDCFDALPTRDRPS